MTVADVAPATAAVGVGGVPGAAIGLTEPDAVEAAEVPEVIEALLDTYRRERLSGETLIATLHRVGIDLFKQAANGVRQSAATEAAAP